MTGADDLRRTLRVRRYVDDDLVLEYRLPVSSTRHNAGIDASWALEVAAGGRRARVIIDDPARDVTYAIVLETVDDEVHGRVVAQVTTDGVEVGEPDDDPAAVLDARVRHPSRRRQAWS